MMAGSEATREAASIDPATGVARIDGMPPGPVKLKAYSQIANWIDGPVVEVTVGEVLEAEIVYDGPDNSRRIVVSASNRPFYTVGCDAESVFLSGQEIERRTGKQLGPSLYVFDDLPEGTYTVEVDHESFEPWSQHGVELGSRVRARLRCNAAIRLAVVDDATGQALENYQLRIRLDGSNSRPNEFELLKLEEVV